MNCPPRGLNVSVRSDDRDDTAGAQDESPSLGLPNRVICLFLDFIRSLVDQRFSAQPTANHSLEFSLGLGQGRGGLAVMPVDDVNRVVYQRVEIYIGAMDVQDVAP